MCTFLDHLEDLESIAGTRGLFVYRDKEFRL